MPGSMATLRACSKTRSSIASTSSRLAKITTGTAIFSRGAISHR